MDIHNILVAFDGSENSIEACSVASTLAKGYGSEITVLHVVPPYGPFSTTRSGTQYYTDLEKIAKNSISKVVRSFAEEGLKTSSAIIQARSSISGSIIKYADTKGCDLVIGGTRGQGFFRRMLLGSVSSILVSHASSPVLVVRKRPDESKTSLDRILLATDGSENAFNAVEYAVSLAKTLKSKLAIVYVVYMSPIDYSSDSTEYISTILKDLREFGEKAVSKASLLASESNVSAEVKIVDNNDSPVVAITELADKEKFNLIVLGTRGLGGFRKLMLGSTANGVVHHANCSVLVIR